VISQAGQPAGQPDLKKPTSLRGAVTFQPAYEVTRVDSMQWNRSCIDFELPEQASAGATEMGKLPADILADLQEAISASERR